MRTDRLAVAMALLLVLAACSPPRTTVPASATPRPQVTEAPAEPTRAWATAARVLRGTTLPTEPPRSASLSLATRTPRTLPTVRQVSTPTPSRTPTPPPTATPEPGRDPGLARVTLRDGSQRTLRGEIKLQGALSGLPPCPQIKLENVNLRNIARLWRAAEGALTLQAGDETLALLPGAQATLTGDGASIPLDEIAEAVLEGGQPSGQPSPEAAWQLILACGQEVQASSLSFSLAKNWQAAWQGLELTVALSDTVAIVRPAEAPDTLQTDLSDGLHLSGLRVKPGHSLSAGTRFGRLTFPVSDLYLAERVQPPAARAEQPTWRMRLPSGEVLTLTELSLTGGRLGGLTVQNADLETALALEVLPAGRVRLEADGERHEVEGATFQARLAGLEATLTGQASSLAALERLRPPAAEGSLPQTATLTLRGGERWPVREPHLRNAEKVPYGKNVNASGNVLVLVAGPVQYWVSEDWVIETGFTLDAAGRVQPLCLEEELCPQGIPPSQADLSVKVGPLRLHTPLNSVARYEPSGAPPGISGRAQLWQLTVEARQGESLTVRGDRLAFSRYPPAAWTGMYFTYEWPFRWYKDDALVLGDDASQERAPLADLRRIEFATPCNTPRCAVRLVDVQGQARDATIYPGSTNQESKHGPATWAPELTGLYLRLSNEISLFVPFAGVLSIGIERL